MSNASTRLFSTTGMLSDNGIRTYFKNGIDIHIDEKDGISFDLDNQLHVGSVDLHFRHLCRRFHLKDGSVLSYESLRNREYTEPFELKVGEKLKIQPGEIILTTSLEIVNLSEDFAAIITGRSSVAKLGIMVHCCQEFIHPGHGQAIPLQIVNLSPYPVELDLSVPICQIVFFKLATSASKKYVDREDAKYSGEISSESSKIYEDVNNNDVGTKSIEKKHLKKNTVALQKFLNKYIVPFLPSTIAYLIITPFLTTFIVNKTLADVWTVFKNLPAPLILALILLAVYIFSKRGEEK